jgi:hypothetical protein
MGGDDAPASLLKNLIGTPATTTNKALSVPTPHRGSFARAGSQCLTSTSLPGPSLSLEKNGAGRNITVGMMHRPSTAAGGCRIERQNKAIWAAEENQFLSEKKVAAQSLIPRPKQSIHHLLSFEPRTIEEMIKRPSKNVKWVDDLKEELGRADMILCEKSRTTKDKFF